MKLIKLINVGLIVILSLSVRGQANKTLYVYNPLEANVSASQSITLLPGFTVPLGSNFRAFISNDANCLPMAASPSYGQNFVITNAVRKSGITQESGIATLTNCYLNQTVNYLDGLGRPLQTVQIKASPSGKDIVLPNTYDSFGRESVRYQQYADGGVADGSFKPNAANDVLTFYSNTPGIKTNPYPFSRTVYEISSLNKVLEEGAPGYVWQPGSSRSNTTGRTVVTEYGTNENNVDKWNLLSNGAITQEGFTPGKLSKVVTKDENWVPADGKAKTTEEFKDMDGRVVLRKIWETEYVDLKTYYIYDDFGNLRYVIPPVPSNEFSSIFNENDSMFLKYVYAYHYDARNRVIEKKIPGKDWEFSVYNKDDQVVLAQDGKQHADGEWIATKYDILGRVVYTGLYKNNTDNRETLQATVTGQASWNMVESWNGNSWTNVSFPQTLNTTLSKMYYDNYSFSHPSTYNFSGSSKTKGLLTGSEINVLGTSEMLLTVNYYDDKGRSVKTFKQHYAGDVVRPENYDEITNSYSFTGELEESTRTHFYATRSNTVIASNYEYDSQGRNLRSFEKINSGAKVLLSENLYNEIGAVKERKLHDGLQKTDLFYNERGWLEAKIANEFSESIHYNEGSNPQYNGNIAIQRWGAGVLPLPNVFSYSYDNLNRLTQAVSPGMQETVSYDSMGNIKTMNREGIAGTYVYTGNRLERITGGLGTGDYVYNQNGSATTDGRMGATIEYNSLNLPVKITASNQVVEYLYAADGTKLRTSSNTLGVTRYVSGIQYHGNDIEFIFNENGVARKNGSDYVYQYNLTDHLGNVRYTFNKHPVTGIVDRLQSDNYFAFGKRLPAVTTAANNKYLYNGKELQEGLNIYDYGARFYDPEVGRWNVVDPLADKMRRYSPYSYAFDNPIRFIDLDGWAPGEPPIYGDLNDPLGNGMSLIENLYWGTRDKASSALVTLGSYLGSLFSDNVTTKKISYTYVGNTRTPTAENIVGNKHVAAAWGVIDILAAVPGEGSMTGMLFSKTAGGKSTAVDVARGIIKDSEAIRIERAATRINKPINLVGSRAGGTAKETSDWDYVVTGITNKEWKKIKNSLPGSTLKMDNVGKRDIDMFKGWVNPEKPFLTFNPKK